MNNDLNKTKENASDQKNQNQSTPLNIGCRGSRIMFVGNSMTLHGIAPAIGWFNECGMAASAPENDYVHILKEKVLAVDPDASFFICQAADWERGYKNGASTYQKYEAARNFDADVIIFRCIENCPKGDFEADVFLRELDAFLKFLNADGEGKVIITTGFWRHPGDEQLRAYAKDNSLPKVELGDLGERDDMKAIGLFEHVGVANHPGDLGMKTMADRIAKELLALLN